MARKAGPTATARTRDWRHLAEAALKRVGTARYGEKEPILRDVAARNGLSLHLVRRAVSVRAAIAKLDAEGTAVPESLLTAPVGIADLICRWAAYDPQAAFEALSRYDQGVCAFRELLTEEVAARPRGGRFKAARAIDVALRWRGECLDRLRRHLSSGEQITLPARDEALPIDAWIDQLGRPGRAAVIVIGPAKEGERHDGELWEIVLRGLGLASIGHPTILVVPYVDVARRYRSWLAAHQVADDRVRVVGVRTPALPLRARGR